MLWRPQEPGCQSVGGALGNCSGWLHLQLSQVCRETRRPLKSDPGKQLAVLSEAHFPASREQNLGCSQGKAPGKVTALPLKLLQVQDQTWWGSI